MKDTQIINNELMEIRNHGDISFPLKVYEEYNPSNLSFFPMHWHSQYEIDLVLDGEVEFTINDNKYYLKKNEAIFINSNCLHSANHINNTSAWIAIVFSPKLIYGYNESIIKLKNIDTFNVSAITLNELNVIQLLNEIIELYHSNTSTKELLIISNLLKLFSIITSSKLINENPNTNHYIRIKKALDYIYTNYKNKITIDDISKEVGLCRTELTKLFKASLNYTISDYILRYKIEQSLPLIRANILNMTEISEEVGFNSSSYFAESFKKIMGISPRQYQKMK